MNGGKLALLRQGSGPRALWSALVRVVEQLPVSCGAVHATGLESLWPDSVRRGDRTKFWEILLLGDTE